MLRYDFAKHDTKFNELRDILRKLGDDKVIIFAFYKATLFYLARRPRGEEIGCALIHSSIPEQKERDHEIERFRDDPQVRILFSSEVGSEGIDLQFCHVVINYDVPWNPMRIAVSGDGRQRNDPACSRSSSIVMPKQWLACQQGTVLRNAPMKGTLLTTLALLLCLAMEPAWAADTPASKVEGFSKLKESDLLVIRIRRTGCMIASYPPDYYLTFRPGTNLAVSIVSSNSRSIFSNVGPVVAARQELGTLILSSADATGLDRMLSYVRERPWLGMSTIRDELTLLHSRGGKLIGEELLILPANFPPNEKRDYLLPRDLIIRTFSKPE